MITMKDKKNKYKILSLLVLGFILSSVGVSAFWQERNSNVDEDVMLAVENEDYDAWKIAMSDSINEEHFELMIENRQERQSRQGMQNDKKGTQRKNNPEFQDLREITREAIENNDYEAYMSAIEEYDGDSTSVSMTEEDFATLVEIHSLQSSLENKEGMGRFSMNGINGMNRNKGVNCLE